MALFKYFKVDKRVKEDNSLGNSDAVLPSSSGSLTQTIPASRTDAINDDVKPVPGRNHYGQRDSDDVRHV